MSGTRYLVDNNALLRLGVVRRRSEFFRDRCRLPEAVVHEARARTDHAALKDLTYAVTPGVLAHLKIVMSDLKASDVSLVDLYKNLGTADPMIIATALDAKEKEDSLFPDEWVIVSLDRALLSKAADLGIQTISPDCLADLVDAAGDGT
jgi:hypothetical protein